MINILLAEDHNIVRDGIRFLLDQEEDMQVIYEAVNGLDVLKWLDKEQKPDVILTDMNMPGMDGLHMINALQTKYPVLILSMLDHENYVMETINAGASGYLLKNISKDELLFAIRYVAGGGKYICSELSFKILNRLSNLNDILPASGVSVDFELSERESEVLHLIGEGFTNNEIADKLFSSRRTIEGHRQSLMEKTGSKNTATLIKFAVQNGLIK
ncbi:MAG: DNA-binding response regulator [Mucilaginibacter sp.]|nr:DNA-binding response regulator [Mucilaginibacter sp.]MDB5111592.1 DNA-binding response regulator [Mucilaginibacter sp.]